eukprot:CAMPEP_0202840112 /NCGR_PEP_ID=MMETSP1389-20130828/54826_1 /ASSEMBLY_ACC=CAM_ASM_000865 /TAXON_ID=302021 /ORGANISM="Rhodomonas sp., Strain CCMP768" /LENGTH=56 /DNA_ID=CAMNT_0049516689 /DNA_START=89 /DNA_END=256 /DNA_ORIENTATION=-
MTSFNLSSVLCIDGTRVPNAWSSVVSATDHCAESTASSTAHKTPPEATSAESGWGG